MAFIRIRQIILRTGRILLLGLALLLAEQIQSRWRPLWRRLPFKKSAAFPERFSRFIQKNSFNRFRYHIAFRRNNQHCADG